MVGVAIGLRLSEFPLLSFRFYFVFDTLEDVAKE